MKTFVITDTLRKEINSLQRHKDKEVRSAIGVETNFTTEE